MGRVNQLNIIWDVRSLFSAFKDLVSLDFEGFGDILGNL